MAEPALTTLLRLCKLSQATKVLSVMWGRYSRLL